MAESLFAAIAVQSASGIGQHALRQAFSWLRPWMFWIVTGYLQWSLAR
jgi:hypothetical protein